MKSAVAVMADESGIESEAIPEPESEEDTSSLFLKNLLDDAIRLNPDYIRKSLQMPSGVNRIVIVKLRTSNTYFIAERMNQTDAETFVLIKPAYLLITANETSLSVNIAMLEESSITLTIEYIQWMCVDCFAYCLTELYKIRTSGKTIEALVLGINS